LGKRSLSMSELSDNPTPAEVMAHYDLHTGEGAANISNDPAAILDLWHALAQSQARCERLERALVLIRDQADGIEIRDEAYSIADNALAVEDEA
jgi:hypothetical protein